MSRPGARRQPHQIWSSQIVFKERADPALLRGRTLPCGHHITDHQQLGGSGRHEAPYIVDKTWEKLATGKIYHISLAIRSHGLACDPIKPCVLLNITLIEHQQHVDLVRHPVPDHLMVMRILRRCKAGDWAPQHHGISQISTTSVLSRHSITARCRWHNHLLFVESWILSNLKDFVWTSAMTSQTTITSLDV